MAEEASKRTKHRPQTETSKLRQQDRHWEEQGKESEHHEENHLREKDHPRARTVHRLDFKTFPNRRHGACRTQL